MKKLVCVLMTLILTLTPAYAATIELSDLSDEELMALQGEIEAEVLSRGLDESYVFPAGFYVGGEDIAIGTYLVSNGRKDWSSQVNLYKSKEDYTPNRSNCYFTYLIHEGETARIEIEEGIYYEALGTLYIRQDNAFPFAPETE